MRLFLMIWGLLSGLAAWGGGRPTESDTLHILQQAHPSLRYDVRELDRTAGDTFLLFDIVQVVNPAAIPLTFTVYYQPSGKDQLHLGGFALYPADNPGRFIVPVQDKLGYEGEILLELAMDAAPETTPTAPAEKSNGTASVRVKLRDVKLIDQLDPI